MQRVAFGGCVMQRVAFGGLCSAEDQSPLVCSADVLELLHESYVN